MVSASAWVNTYPRVVTVPGATIADMTGFQAQRHMSALPVIIYIFITVIPMISSSRPQLPPLYPLRFGYGVTAPKMTTFEDSMPQGSDIIDAGSSGCFINTLFRGGWF